MHKLILKNSEHQQLICNISICLILYLLLKKNWENVENGKNILDRNYLHCLMNIDKRCFLNEKINNLEWIEINVDGYSRKLIMSFLIFRGYEVQVKVSIIQQLLRFSDESFEL